MGIIRILYKQPGRPWQEADIESTQAAISAAVGGVCEAWGISKTMRMIASADKSKPYNCRVLGADLYGTAIVVGVHGDVYTDIDTTLENWQRYWIGADNEVDYSTFRGWRKGFGKCR